MACPFFMPIQLSGEGSWLHPARLPLGAGWSGHCTAPGHEGQTPELAQLQDGCNLGYALRCPRLPIERSWDAVRFGVAREEAQQIVLNYACERSHRPADHGQLRFELGSGTWRNPHADPRIQKMAECFLRSYLAGTGRQATSARNL